MELESWREVLSRWTVEEERPRHLASLVRLGIPEALRGEVWQRLATSDTHIIDNYRILITKVFFNLYRSRSGVPSLFVL